MKNNSVPVTVRLQRRINGLQSQMAETVKIGGGNTYHKCGACGRSVPEISNKGHYLDCPLPGKEKEIRHYTRLLEEAREPKEAS